MRVFVDPIPQMSRAMDRVSAALRIYAPRGVRVVDRVEEADLQILHAIGPNSIECVKAPRFATIQYCLYSASGPKAWHSTWKRSVAVWSYYDLTDLLPSGVRFFYAPLGVDFETFRPMHLGPRYIGVVTSGYVSGPGAEAIEEVADAALQARTSVFHLGPTSVVGMCQRRESSWSAQHGIPDSDLAGIYNRARWVSGLRRIEGFELPVLEGLACGARPIVFDREDMKCWYTGLATFVPEVGGAELVEILAEILRKDPMPVSKAEHLAIRTRFNWQTLCAAFWSEVLR